MATTWTFNGSNSVSVTFDSNPGDKYELNSNFGSVFASATASGSTLTLTDSGASGGSAGQTFDVYVNTAFPTADAYVASNIFKVGTSSSSGETLDANWTYDGSTGFSVEFAAPNLAHDYQAIIDYIHGNNFTSTGGSNVAGGSDITCSVTAATSIDTGRIVRLRLIDATTFQPIASRMFVQGTAGSGSAGSPGGAFSPGGGGGGGGAGAGGIRVSIAFDAGSLEEDPDWTDITELQPTLVSSYDLYRGRQYELDQTDAGTCTINIWDRNGVFDPTNSIGPYYTKIEPDLQIQIELWNPVTEDWHSRFRGWIEDFDWTLDPSQKVLGLTVTCYDVFALLTAIEMQPGAFGDAPPAGVEGVIYFDDSDFQSRIEQVITNAGVTSGFYVIFTGNVDLLPGTYSPGQNPMEVVQDCVDAEFPGVSNVYPDRFGRLAAHGRLAKFDPAGTAASTTPDRWDYREWKLGDGAAFEAAPSDIVQMRPPFSFNRGRSKIINQALCYPADIAQGDIAGQLVTDSTSVGLRGLKSWSKENLLVAAGTLTGNSGKDEAKAYGSFYVANGAEPRNRFSALIAKTVAPDNPRGANVWEMLTHSDIADRADVTITHPGGGGFNLEPGFIEGITETAEPLNGDYAMVTQAYDVSPMALFTGDLVGLDGA